MELCVGIVAVIVLLFVTVYFLIYVLYRLVTLLKGKSDAGATEQDDF